jgi:hypothetical protein
MTEHLAWAQARPRRRRSLMAIAGRDRRLATDARESSRAEVPDHRTRSPELISR